MDGCTVHVTLRVCAALEAAVARSFGPMGLEQLVVTAGTQLTVTNSGSAILQRLSIAHSVGAFVQAAVQSHGTHYGDHSTAMVIMVTAALRQAAKEMGPASPDHSRARLLELVRALRVLRTTQLPLVLNEYIANCALVVPWSRPEHARAVVLSLLHTAFAGKLGGTAPACLARLLTGLIMRSTSGCAAPPSEVLRTLCVSPPVATLPGSPVSASCVLHGVIISEPLRSPSMPASREPAGVVVARCSLELADAQVARAAVRVQSAAAYDAMLLWKESAVRATLLRLRERGAHLVLCTERVSDLVATTAAELQIAIVQLVPEEEAQRLCVAAGIVPLTSNVESAVASAHVCQVQGYRECTLAAGPRPRRCVHVRPEPCAPTTTSAYTPYTLLLRAPNDGLCRQYNGMIARGLRIVSSSTIAAAALPEPVRRLSQVVGAAHAGELEGDTLVVVSGGGSLEAALSRADFSGVASYVGGQEEEATCSGCSGVAGERLMTEAGEGRDAALRILQSTFASVPYALAQSCSGLSLQQRGGDERASRRRVPLVMVQALCEAQQASDGGLPRRPTIGFVVQSAACSSACGCLAPSLGRPAPTPADACGADAPVVGMAIDDAAAFGILESFQCKYALVLSVVDLALQLLRVDGIVSVTRLTSSLAGKGVHRRGAASGREAQAGSDSDSERSTSGGDDSSEEDG